MDVLLVQPPIQDFYLTAKRTIPYGLASIAASLKKAGFTAGVLDGLATGKSRPVPLPAEMEYLEAFYGRPDISPFCLFHGYRHFGYSFQYLEQQIRCSGASIVGISSLFTAYSMEAEKTAAIAKKALPGAVIVVGGHHPTALPEDVMGWHPVDYAVRGDGETALPLLAGAVKYGGEISRVPGIVFRKSNGGLHISAPAVIEKLDTAPLPELDSINNTYYTRGRYPSTVVVTSRGCPLHCSYCSLGNRDLYPYRQRSVHAVMMEISRASKTYGARFIDFEDENLSFSKKWFMALLQKIRGEFGNNRLELRAMNGLYPPTLDEDVIVAMKEAGFRTLNLSLGATCPKQLERFQRPDVRPAFENCLNLAEKHDLNAVGYVICGAPGQDAMQSLEDLLYLARRNVLAGLSVFYPAPGSRDCETSKALGILPAHHSLYRSSAIPISHTTSRLQAITLLRLSRIINFMKALIDKHHSIPSPGKLSDPSLSNGLDRFQIGMLLLEGFLYDGVIRGVTPDGTIYRHSVDPDLVRRFLSILKTITVVGTIPLR